MKTFSFFCLLSMGLFLGCTKDDNTIDQQILDEALFGKWDAVSAVNSLGNPIETTIERGFNFVGIYYIELGIEFFEDGTFNMRTTNTNDSLYTYSNRDNQLVNWNIDGNRLLLSWEYSNQNVEKKEAEFEYTLPDEQTLEMGHAGSPFKVVLKKVD